MARPAGLYGDFSMTLMDAGNEAGRLEGTARVVIGTDAASNLETQVDLFDTFITRVDALTLGAQARQQYVNENTIAWTQPTNGAARETKLLIQYKCTATGKPYTMTIPTIDPTIPDYVININAKDVIRMDSPAEITQLVTAFNAFVVAPDIPNVAGVYATDPACTVVGLKVVGRST